MQKVKICLLPFPLLLSSLSRLPQDFKEDRLVTGNIYNNFHVSRSCLPNIFVNSIVSLLPCQILQASPLTVFDIEVHLVGIHHCLKAISLDVSVVVPSKEAHDGRGAAVHIHIGINVSRGAGEQTPQDIWTNIACNACHGRVQDCVFPFHQSQ